MQLIVTFCSNGTLLSRIIRLKIFFSWITKQYYKANNYKFQVYKNFKDHFSTYNEIWTNVRYSVTLIKVISYNHNILSYLIDYQQGCYC